MGRELGSHEKAAGDLWTLKRVRTMTEEWCHVLLKTAQWSKSGNYDFTLI